MSARALIKTVDRRLGIQNRIRGLPAGGFDLAGEKELDWGWVVSHLPVGAGRRILEVGCCQSPVLPAACALGFEAVGVDVGSLPYVLPGMVFRRGDFLDVDLPAGSFDVVVLCSVVEHVGLVGRYGQRDVPDGDFKAMQKAAALLKPNGKLFLTVPVGRDLVFSPWHRIYGAERLPRLIEGLSIEADCFYLKHRNDPWRSASRGEAMAFDGKGLSYALGQFILAVGSGT